ncbi:hypothetical protein BC828DRAFT_208095 [Blastocladiella britannica]|nr:hypothetical protein BC828DRAFT_208095 [Blastocladiella britannica]
MVLVNELGVVEGVNYPLMLLTGHSPLSITHVTDIDQLFSIAAEPDEAGGMGDAMTDHTFSDVTSSIRSPSSSSATGSATPTMTRRSTATAVALSPRRVILPDMPLSPSGAHFSDITTCVSEHDDAHDDDAHDDDDHLVSPRTPIHSNKSLVIDTRIGMLSPGVSSLLRPGQHKVVICCAHPPPLQPDSELFDSSELLPSQSAWGDQTWSALTSLPSALTYQRAIDRQAAAAGTTAALHLREVSAAAAVVTPIIAVAGVAPTPGHPTVSKVIVLTDLSELHARDRQLRALVHETAALNLKQRQLLLFLAHELRNPLYVVQGHMETDVDDEVDAKKKNLAMEAINFSTAILDGLVEYIEAGHALFDLPVHGPADQDTVHVRVRDLFSDGPPRPDIEALATLPPCVQCTFPVASVLRKLAAFCHGMPVPGTSSLFVSPERHVQLHQWTASGDRAVIHLVFLSTICDTQVAILGQPLSWLSTGSVVQDPSVRLLSLQLAVLSRAIMQSGGSLRVDLTRRMVEIEVVGCRVCGDPGCQPLPPLSPLHVTPAATAAATADDDMALLSPTATSPQLESIPPVAPPPRLLPEEETPATTTTAAPPPPLVLLVEDNRIVQKMTRRLLERAGLAVLVAEHGQQALNMLRDKNSDLAATVRVVLMDLQMPVMGGIECTEIIRHEEVEWRGDQGRRLPIVALTANAMAEERDRCLATGFDGFLTKPVNRETLVAELRLRIGEW